MYKARMLKVSRLILDIVASIVFCMLSDSITSSVVNMPEKWSISSSDTSAGTKTLQNANMASLLSNDGFVCEIAVSTRATHASNCNCNDEEVVFLSTAAILSPTY